MPNPVKDPPNGEKPNADDTKPDDTKPDNTPPPNKEQKEGSKKKIEVDEDYLESLKTESIQRRKENKELKEKVEKFDKALSVLTGKSEKGEAEKALETAQAKYDEKHRRVLLLAELATKAKDAHDVKALLRANPEAFKGVTVDLETDEVDEAALTKALDGLRKSQPFFFAGKEGGNAPPPKTKVPADTNNTPGGGGNPYATWKAMKEAGNTKAAQEYYEKHRSEIKEALRNLS